MKDNLMIQHLNKSFQTKEGELQVLKDINLEIKKGELVSIVGHSGCGKSTLLKIVSGLVDYQDGSVKIDGEEIRNADTNCRIIFQTHNLLPWMTVKENVAFGLYHVPDKDRLVQDEINLVHLNGFENAYPQELSGGMAQRAAIARALVRKPEILLLDEPFGALDALTRIEMQKEVLNIWHKEKSTMLLVTHDIEEAIYLSTKIVVVSNRPATIKKIFNVDLPWPRRRNTPEFTNLKAEIFRMFFESDDQQTDLEYYI
ncbi:MAG: ABC transporter ATP-binding protein [Blautia sp.]|nr:ABC transporter ATP-binding protein [Blautia sp.]